MTCDHAVTVTRTRRTRDGKNLREQSVEACNRPAGHTGDHVVYGTNATVLGRLPAAAK